MAGVSLAIDTADLQEIDAALAEALEKASQTRGLMENIAGILETSAVQRFEEQRGPNGEPWEKSQAARDRGGLTLVDNAILMGSITSRASDAEAEVGSNVVYARIHQLGGRAGRGHSMELPARPYLGVGEGDGAAISDAMHDHFRRAFG